jgi:hypothetical protein
MGMDIALEETPRRGKDGIKLHWTLHYHLVFGQIFLNPNEEWRNRACGLGAGHLSGARLGVRVFVK